jgi:ABC-type transport system, involved in lipoprotein release, permease component
MLIFIKLAMRNLLRNKRRTAITMTGISLGLALMVFSNNIAFGSHESMLRTAIGMMAGHVVVQGEGYQHKPDSKLKVLNSGAMAQTIRAAIPDATVTRRIYMDGLLVSPVASTSAVVKAIEPSRELQVIDLDDKIVQGQWLADDDDRGIMLGQDLATRLDLGLGDKVVFMGQPDGTEVESRLFRLRGIFRTGSPEIDGFTALAPLSAAQELFQGDDPATQIAINLPDDQQTAARTEQVRSLVQAAAPDSKLEVLPWQQAIPDIVEFVKLDSAYGDGIWLVLGIIVSMGVINTVLMSVMERVREFGVMMAVGLKPRKLAAMVLTEGFVMGAISALIGIILGTLVTWPFISMGIDFSGDMGESMEAAGVPISMILYPEIDWGRLAIYPFIGIFFATVASLYPAWKVTRLSPVQAIRHQ